MASTSGTRSNPNEAKSSRPIRKYDIQQLKNIKVAIRRPHLPGTGSNEPLLRSLDDPFDIVIHRSGEGQKPIFDREGVIANLIEPAEERIIVKSPEQPHRRENCKESSDKYGDYSRNVRRKSRDLSPYQSKSDSYKRDSYPSTSSYKSRRPRSPSRDSRDREKSPYSKEYKPPKDYESGRHNSPRNSYRERLEESKMRHERQRGAKDADRSSRRSPPGTYPRSHSPHSKYYRSPPRPTEGGYRGPGKSYPEYRDRSPSSKHKDGPSSARRSRSPHHSDRYKGRRSASPSPYKSYSRRSRSPRSYKDYRRSRSPEEYRKRERRSRSSSRDRYKHRSRSPYRSGLPDQLGHHATREVSYIGPILPYYPPETYWIPPPHPEAGARYRPPPMPHIAPALFRPHMFIPRPLYPGPRIERQRLPIYNNRSIKLPSVSSAEAATSADGKAACTTTVENPGTSTQDDAVSTNNTLGERSDLHSATEEKKE